MARIRSILLLTCIVVLYILIDRYLTKRRIQLYVKQVINNRTCNHNVTIHQPDGTTDTVQRCYPLLINFADGCCTEAQEYNCFTGVLHGAHQCLKFNKAVLDHDPLFRTKNQGILNRKRGAGYWLWKPYLLLRELYLASEGDIIIYSDAAVNISASLYHLINLTQFQDIIVFEQGWKVCFCSSSATLRSSLRFLQEYVWTKRDTMIIMDVDRSNFHETLAGVASYLVLRKSLTSMRFVSEWLTYAQDSRALTDDSNVLHKKNYDGFRQHRHDQSILGLLAKKWNITIYPDPSQYGEGLKRPYPTIFNHHRQKD